MTPQDRLTRDEAAPDLVRLHRALSPLGSVLTVMNTGAHPDDEKNGLLAWLRFGLGMRTIVACSTRGEGGQNVLGPERGGALGLLRSREMEEAARVIDADVVWLGHGPADPVHDFGFSKDGDDTFARWGEERIVERLVRAYRRERPDIVIPTFLDVPGQHGHHRAMTRAAETALALAADPDAFPEHRAAGLAPWRVAKFYLPAWSGGGGTYDDELPPPETTLLERARGRDVATGADYARIGEWSRARHASQGMGVWQDVPTAEWPLHLRGGAPEETIADDLPRSLRDLVTGGAAAAPLTEAADALDAAREAFPACADVVAALASADAALEQAEAALSGDADAHALHGHRLANQRRAIQHAMIVAIGLTPDARAEPATLAPGARGTIVLRAPEPLCDAPMELSVSALLPDGAAAESAPLRPGTVQQIAVEAAVDARYSDNFAPGFTARGGNPTGSLVLEGEIAGRPVRAAIDLAEPLRIAPARLFDAVPDSFVLRDGTPAEPTFSLSGDAAEATFEAPDGVSVEVANGTGRIHLKAPTDALATIVPHLDCRAAMRATPVVHRHVGAASYLESATLRVRRMDLALPEGARVGWIGGGSDRTGLWMQRMGLDVTTLDRIDGGTDLSRFTTLVIGVVALASRPDVLARLPAIHDFVERGGTLVTLYQRPDQGWDPDTVPPRRLVIGTPSLRWRVTDPEAAVTALDPDHPVLTAPNRIGPADWAGWDKERGLYFAAEWDPAYQPLLEMADRGETPLRGALVSGRIGAGRHTHASLVLHHQLERLVPGAFRLLANMVRPEG